MYIFTKENLDTYLKELAKEFSWQKLRKEDIYINQQKFY